MNDVSDSELLELVIAADEDALLEGKSPKQRMLPIISVVMKRLGYAGFIFAGVNTPPIVDRISNLYRSLYRRSDLAVGGIHGGIFMFRDVFGRIAIPMGYGTIKIDPLTLTDFSENQIRWLCARQSDVAMFYDQFTDIFDFAGGVGPFGDYKPPPKEAAQIFQLAAFQLQAAAAALSVAFDHRGAVQSSMIGAELALKGGLAAMGATEKELKEYGHDIASAANDFAAKQPQFDVKRVVATIGRFPPYVKNRYSPKQPSRVDVGHIAMGAQYVAGEVMRQICGFSIRSAGSFPAERVYPSC